MYFNKPKDKSSNGGPGSLDGWHLRSCRIKKAWHLLSCVQRSLVRVSIIKTLLPQCGVTDECMSCHHIRQNMHRHTFLYTLHVIVQP